MGLLQTLLETIALHPALSGSGAQYADIGVAVNRYVVDASIALIDVLECLMEGVVVHAITAVQQSAVNIEEVGVKAVPVEAAGLRRDLGFTHSVSVTRCRSILRDNPASTLAL